MKRIFIIDWCLALAFLITAYSGLELHIAGHFSTHQVWHNWAVCHILASLTYTGINKHTADEVGGWDTTIRRTQYEKLFYNQQSSMSEVDYSSYSSSNEPIEIKRTEQPRMVVKVERPQSKTVVQPQSVRSAVPVSPMPSATPNDVEIDNIKAQLEALAVDSTVIHKKFGKGTVIKINKNEKFIYIKFALGEKKFVFPDAFLMGFLEIG